jgi:hypothetical protein
MVSMGTKDEEDEVVRIGFEGGIFSATQNGLAYLMPPTRATMKGFEIGRLPNSPEKRYLLKLRKALVSGRFF